MAAILRTSSEFGQNCATTAGTSVKHSSPLACAFPGETGRWFQHRERSRGGSCVSAIGGCVAWCSKHDPGWGHTAKTPAVDQPRCAPPGLSARDRTSQRKSGDALTTNRCPLGTLGAIRGRSDRRRAFHPWGLYGTTTMTDETAGPEHQRAAMRIFDEMVRQNLSLRDCVVAVYLAGIAKAGSAPKRKREPRGPAQLAPTSEVWEAYRSGYSRRYCVEPVRNASVNGQLAQFITRIPIDEAPAVAAFYLSHQGGLYVSAKHPVNLLLRDAEKLRTDWATRDRKDPERRESGFAQERRTKFEALTGGRAASRPTMEDGDVLPDTTRLLG